MSSSIEDFVMKYIELSRSQVRAEENCFHVSFGTDPEYVHTITFSSEVARHRRCELVEVGSPFFRRIVEDIRRRGVCAAVLPSTSPDLALSRIPFSNCKFNLESVEEIQRNALKLRYLVTLSSTKRWQKIVEIALDESGQELRWLYSVGEYLNDRNPDRPGKALLQFLLDSAALVLEKKVEEDLGLLREESERLLSSSIDRVQRYYAQLRDEAINEAEYARSRAESSPGTNKGSFSMGLSLEEAERLMAEYDRLEALDIEREKARYCVKAEATLIGALLLRYKVFECQVRLQNEKKSRKIVLDLLPNGEVQELLCEACNQSVKEVHLCSSGHIVGQECVVRTDSSGEYCTMCKSQRQRQ